LIFCLRHSLEESSGFSGFLEVDITSPFQRAIPPPVQNSQLELRAFFRDGIAAGFLVSAAG
jgi:hypothetical protein